jgi:hypothetical protein
MATLHATARFRRPSAMQLNHIDIAEDATVRHLLVDLCTTEFSDWSASQGDGTSAYCSFPSWLSQRRGLRPNPRR